jgi:hypothetical protein
MFARLEFVGLLYREHFSVQATPHPNLAALHPSISVEWDQLVVTYFVKTCRSFDCRLEAVVVKNGTFIKYIVI